MPYQKENDSYLHSQLITYIGNKRALLDFIGEGVEIVQNRLGKEKLNCLDVFCGSGIISRYLKQFSKAIAVNDLENYSYEINKCYLANISEIDFRLLKDTYHKVIKNINDKMKALDEARKNHTYKAPGFISELYSPEDSNHVKAEERCFYTTYNANYLDCARQAIEEIVPENYKPFFIGPLLSEASIHANTAGIFKGFYKNSKTGIGQFGGNGKNALSRIMGRISLPLPVFSDFECRYRVFNEDANNLVTSEELYDKDFLDGESEYDLAYFDPPYNQHPYGSNYFMLNLISKYEAPDTEKISRVSGIPKNWNRSSYNKKKLVSDVFFDLVKNVRAKFVLISFNSEGFIPKDEMIELLSKCGKVQVLESKYKTYRGSRNHSGRDIHLKEYLFLLEKN